MFSVRSIVPSRTFEGNDVEFSVQLFKDASHLTELTDQTGNLEGFRALSFCQNWPARTVSLQRKCSNLNEYLHEDSSHSPGGVYIILEVCLFEGVVELVLPNTQTGGRSVLSNGKRPKSTTPSN